MYILQLKYFQVAARKQHITQAAQELGISQSTLSGMLGKLEKEIGVPLFERQGRNIRLTGYGERLLFYSEIVFNKLEHIYLEMDELKYGEIPYTVKIGVSDNNFYHDWLAALLQEKPDFQLQIFQLPRQEISKRLLLGELDIGLSWAMPYHDTLVQRLILRQPYQLLVSNHHPLAGEKRVDVMQLPNLQYISLPPTEQHERLVDFLGESLHFHPNIIFEGYAEVMAEFLRSARGVIITCPHNIPNWIGQGDDTVHVLDIDHLALHYETVLVWVKNRYYPKQVWFLLQHILNYYRDGQMG